MYPNQNEKTILNELSQQATTMVWWKPEQRARGEDVINDPTKGERPWIIPETTGAFLYETVISNRSRSVLELGTSIGYSGLWIAFALRHTQGHLHTIERSENKISVARKVFKNAHVDELITLHEGMIMETLTSFDRGLTFDGVFLDADRGHYHEYFPVIERHLSPNAWVIADNARNMSKRMSPFFELLEKLGWEYTILDIDNGVLVAQKKTL